MMERRRGDFRLAWALMLALMAGVGATWAVAAESSKPPAAAPATGQAVDAATDSKGQVEAAAKPSVPDVEHGRQIFETICSNCHRTDYEASAVGAPGLRDVMERHTPEWEDQWLTSPAAFAKRDETAKALVESNPYGLTMPTLPVMQDPKNRRDVIAFLKTLKGD